MPPVTTTPAGLTCITCEYELTGLCVAGRCPECGTPIEASFPVAGLLRFAPALDQRAATRGLAALATSGLTFVAITALYLAVFLAVLLAAVVLWIVRGTDVLDRIFEAIAVPAIIVACVATAFAAICYAYGLWRLTGPVVRTSHAARWDARLARWTPVVILGAPVLVLSLGLAGGLAGAALAVVLVLALLAIHHISVRLTLRHLARRCASSPDISLGLPWLVLLVIGFLGMVFLLPAIFVALAYPCSLIDPVSSLHPGVRRELEQARASSPT